MARMSAIPGHTHRGHRSQVSDVRRVNPASMPQDLSDLWMAAAEQPHLMCAVTNGSHPARVPIVVDTGSVVTMMTAKVARKLGLTLRECQAYFQVANNQTAKVTA